MFLYALKTVQSAKAQLRQTSRDLVTYNASGTPNIWLGRGGLRGGDMGGWAVGFRDALNLLSYLTRKQGEIGAAVNVTGPNV